MAHEDDEEEETKRMETSSLASEEELVKGLRAENRTSAQKKNKDRLRGKRVRDN